MKRTFGIILLVIVGLNLLAIINSSMKSEPIGSPGYIILLILMFFGGIKLLNSSNKNNSTPDE